MKSSNPPIHYLYICLAWSIPMTLILFMVTDGFAGSTIGLSNLIECVMPTMVTGLALIIYFIHKARLA